MKGEEEMFLIRICKDLRIQRLLWRPVTMVSFDRRGVIGDVELVEKSVIVCDSCGQRVAVTEKDLDEKLPMGYALCDEECIIEVVCEDCRQRYFKHLRIYDDLEQALDGGEENG